MTRPIAVARLACACRDGDTTAEAVFNRSMVELTRLAAAEVMRVRDFSNVDMVADVGGGFGEMLAGLLIAHPRMKGTLLDLPPAIAGAAEHLARAGVSERCELVAGSFFDSVPHGADVYLLKSVLHSWDDAHCLLTLRNCRAAMSKDARALGTRGRRFSDPSGLRQPCGPPCWEPWELP